LVTVIISPVLTIVTLNGVPGRPATGRPETLATVMEGTLEDMGAVRVVAVVSEVDVEAAYRKRYCISVPGEIGE